jgi:hypothetical protein
MSTSDVLKACHSGMDRRNPEAMEGIGANFDNRETLHTIRLQAHIAANWFLRSLPE